jgi:hypothetical protein
LILATILIPTLWIATDKKDNAIRMNASHFAFPGAKVYQQIITPDNALLLYGPENPGNFSL